MPLGRNAICTEQVPHVRVSSCQVQTFPEQHVYCVIAKYE